LRNIGQDLGGAVKGFKDGMKSADEPAVKTQDQIQQSSSSADKTVDVHAKDINK